MKYWMQNVHHSITIWNGYLKLADLARSVRTSRTYRTDLTVGLKAQQCKCKVGSRWVNLIDFCKILIFSLISKPKAENPYSDQVYPTIRFTQLDPTCTLFMEYYSYFSIW